MKRRHFTYLFYALLLVSCIQTPNHSQTGSSEGSRKNRDKNISFMGIRLGATNGSEVAVIDSSEQLITRSLPDGFQYYLGSGNGAIFENPREKTLNTFFTSVIDKQNDKHSGWGMVKSDCDSITTIHFIFTSCEDIQDVFNKIKGLYVERYGQPDDSCVVKLDKEGTAADLQNSYCFWEFSNDQRITLNRYEYVGYEYGGLFSNSERVEIVYQDMKAVHRLKRTIEEREIAKKHKRNQEEKARKEENRTAKGHQQL